MQFYGTFFLYKFCNIILFNLNILKDFLLNYFFSLLLKENSEIFIFPKRTEKKTQRVNCTFLHIQYIQIIVNKKQFYPFVSLQDPRMYIKVNQKTVGLISEKKNNIEKSFPNILFKI